MHVHDVDPFEPDQELDRIDRLRVPDRQQRQHGCRNRIDIAVVHDVGHDRVAVAFEQRALERHHAILAAALLIAVVHNQHVHSSITSNVSDCCGVVAHSAQMKSTSVSKPGAAAKLSFEIELRTRNTSSAPSVACVQPR